MASLLKSLSASFLLFLLFLQLTDGFKFFNEAELSLNNVSNMIEIGNRKMLVVNDSGAKEAVFDIGGKGSKGGEEGWELRAAPLGPDPLHHHGADPTKPRTP